MGFGAQIEAFAQATKAKSESVAKEVIRGVARSLVDRSPVGDVALWAPSSLPPPKGYEGGRFKANWQGGVGTINHLVTDDIDPTGEISLIEIEAKIPERPSDAFFYITNSLPYAQRLEDGWSSQAPAGMVSLTVLDFNLIVDAAVAKVNIT